MRRRRRRPDKAASGSKRAGPPNSLFGEILDWLLAPLLFLWPISIIITHNVADNIANQPYDLALADGVRTLSRMVVLEDGKPAVRFPAPPRALFRADQDDVLYFQVADEHGVVITGDPDIPRPLGPVSLAGEDVLFRDETIHGEETRIAYRMLRPGEGEGSPLVLVQVAETRNKRGDLASRVVTGVLLPQFAIIPLAVVLVWVGLSRGITPLNRLQSLIRRRRPTDLSPVQPASVPEEVRPLIVAFNDMMARLEENLQAQQRFIADAAHQMRTPLTGLKMQTDLALHETDPEQLRLSLAHIAESTDRAAHLINQLLSLARAEASFEKLYAVEPVNLGTVVREVALELFPRAQAKDIDLGAEGSDGELRVEGNPVLLREMVKNLVDNAIKYTPRGGHVTVRTRFAGSPILEVEDTGPGIPEADRERVFERFYRVLGSGADGSGLGLPIVREIGELHRATVTLDANPAGQGTLARVVFPRSHLQAPPPVHGDVYPLG
ncbi:sensor histidine kinase [Thauera linaloolentis]|uniref:histidine kinase n=1 Tax=Thauera linaloolentis (strain DSM 12138 / JCM 21573 / CCUG 41526 / CIP 105981 / IAM 15112 / NBRC 102519 / 47Lol) TaxID=1123367 RepID=N6Z713_THAL4|nr:sensor histidine kinase [Thauera linaloolentis]ENO90337.1 histidine kinase [Thauera linaloolentis 47Lol = DSM 12138]MCM8564090.1 sensor histidine kinase N-terminal domain-containing protein [Thauera linaloolentis]